MTKVVAALDTSMAANPVLLKAVALGRLLNADVEAVHVAADGNRGPRVAVGEESWNSLRSS